MKAWRTSEKPRILTATAPPTAPSMGNTRKLLGVKVAVAQRLTTHGRIAQSGPERLPYKQEVAGSNPASPTL